MSRVGLGVPMQRRRPSPSLIISIVALVFAMSGTAYAATGGTFLLGKANTASTLTALTNSTGTALSLTAPANKPPLTVSNGTQIPNLNASKLGGLPASAFLPVTGSAADSSKLGGVPASGYMQGGGSTTGSRLSLQGGSSAVLATFPGGEVYAGCSADSPTLAAVSLQPATNSPAGSQAVWWNRDGTSSYPYKSYTGGYGLMPLTPNVSIPYIVTLRVDNLTSISTVTMTEWIDQSFIPYVCRFSAQVVTSNG